MILIKRRPGPLSAAVFLVFSVGSAAALAACGGDDEPPASADLGADGPVGDAGRVCASAADCDDHVYCNGAELCAPTSAGARADGCVSMLAPACPSGETCNEDLDTCQTSCAVARDADGDGHVSSACVGGDDCDDTDATRFAGATRRACAHAD